MQRHHFFKRQGWNETKIYRNLLEALFANNLFCIAAHVCEDARGSLMEEQKVCGKCVSRCFNVGCGQDSGRQFCQVDRNIFLDVKFENYKANVNGCEKFEKGVNSFYGKAIVR